MTRTDPTAAKALISEGTHASSVAVELLESLKASQQPMTPKALVRSHSPQEWPQVLTQAAVEFSGTAKKMKEVLQMYQFFSSTLQYKALRYL